MKFDEKFISEMTQAENEYELIGICYRELLKYVKETDCGFVVKAQTPEADSEYAPFSEDFYGLRENLLRCTERTVLRRESCGLTFQQFRNEMLEHLNEFQCPGSLTEKECAPVSIYYTLEALDEYVRQNLREQENYLWERGNGAPLNHGNSREACLVYPQEQQSFLSGAYSGKDGFRKVNYLETIGQTMEAIFIIRKEELPRTTPGEPPRIVHIPLRETCKDGVLKKKKFRIASIPYIGFRTMLFHRCDKDEPCEPGKEKQIKGPFYVEYNPEWEVDNQKRVLELLRLAIREGANFIIFPEFIMSPGMRQAIQNFLKKLTPPERNQLLLVFAGTSFEWDGKKGSNTLHILNAEGIEIGCYYKTIPYRVKNGRTIHASKGHKNKRQNFYLLYEKLDKRGSQCTLIDVEGIGRILPAICRDMVDEEYTYNLANLFLPSLLFIPAWSGSVNGFRTGMEHITQKIHAASLLCNCCDAVGHTKDGNSDHDVLIGLFNMPEKEDTYMKAQCHKIQRKAECAGACRERGGCVVPIDVSFDKGIPVGDVREAVYPEK